MKAAALLTLFLTVSISGQAGRPAAGLPPVTVYKSATCGCCSKWVEHMRKNGFKVTVVDLPDVAPVKTKYGVPRDLESCHTALAGTYVIEGHIPAGDVKRILREKPAVVGIAAPGMPAGSPGMEMPGNIKFPPYNVVTFDKKGVSRLYASH